jgi:hypothetical protein
MEYGMLFNKNISEFRIKILPPASVRRLLQYDTYKGLLRWENFPILPPFITISLTGRINYRII